MWLDNRLRAVVDEISGSMRTIDVGSDHGKVIITALSEHRTAYGIASDISASSLEKAKNLSREAGIMVVPRLVDKPDPASKICNERHRRRNPTEFSKK